ncbi:MAG: toprim domain-containing protein, partial [Opitutaceae bacterium]
TGHEHLRGRIVFPVIAESGEVGTIYGRAIGDVEKHERHLFLPGPQRGVWNPAALRSPSVIVTEGIIDALTFWCAGFRNVTTCFSAKALPEELLDALLAAKVSQVLLAFDRDASGDEATAAAGAQLAARGIECLRVIFPPGHDANSYALSVTPAEKSLGLLLRSAVPLDGSRRLVSPPSASRAPVSSLAAEAANGSADASPASQPACGEPAEPGAAVAANTPPTTTEEAARKEAAAKSTAAPATTTTNDNATSENTTAAAATPAASSPTNVVTIAKNEPEEVVLLIGDREYRVRGLAKNAGIESLKVALRVTCGERWHLDTIDLCLARERERFINAAACETALKPELIKRDLGRVLFTLEQLQEQRLRAALAPQKPGVPELAAPLRERALAVLRDPQLLERILEAFAACGLVGEEINKLVGYLAATTRLMERPLAIIIQSTSAAGKTALMDAILAFFPPETRVKYSAMTGQALYYLGDADLRHKILAIVEEEGAEKAGYALKLLQSEGELSIASTGKDPHTGRMVTQEYRVEGPVMIFLTTTAVDLDEELLNRCLVLTVDESREQTRRIHAQQRARYTLEGIAAAKAKSDVLTLHRAMQSLLQPYEVHIPWVDRLTFLDEKTRTRRDHNKYLQLIATVALLHQYQRDIRPVTCADGRTVPCVIATLDDLAIANKLAHETLGRCLDDMPPQTRRFLLLLDDMVAQRCAAKKLERTDCLFRQRDARAFSGWSDFQVKTHLRKLVELDYVFARRDPDGLGLLYELAYDGAGQDGRRFLCGLFDVEKLRASHDYAEGREHRNEGREHGGSPAGAAREHGGSTGENRDSSSENRAPDAKSDGNAVPGDGEKDAAA